MGTITNIQRNQGRKGDRVYVHIDNQFCASIRERTWGHFNLAIGDTADCEWLKEEEKFIFKQIYDWDKEKVRLQYVEKWFNKYIPYAHIELIGFGADSTERINSHPDEKGEPDMKITLAETNKVILFLEVTGTEYKRPNNEGKDEYWIRPDKIDYIQKHYDNNIWVALHYADTKQIIWIKPEKNKKYEYVEKVIKNVKEYYVLFYKDSREVYTSESFKQHLDSRKSFLENG